MILMNRLQLHRGTRRGPTQMRLRRHSTWRRTNWRDAGYISNRTDTSLSRRPRRRGREVGATGHGGSSRLGSQVRSSAGLALLRYDIVHWRRTRDRTRRRDVRRWYRGSSSRTAAVEGAAGLIPSCDETFAATAHVDEDGNGAEVVEAVYNEHYNKRNNGCCCECC